MDTQKQQIVDRLKQANNILVTVKSNPTVDHLAACIGLTLALNKMGKHATAVFSGEIPSTIEFLQPEKTLEKNTDSLRDFIIALDKSKADKLRYKVEDKVVKIFITPYRTSISEQDLNFSQGDFNVDVVMALGVHLQTDLDQAITAHGRILHDATIASVNVAEGPNLGSLNWTKPDASSLSELVVELMDAIDKQLLDSQIATAVLTGIVAETDRFSNNRTSPQTMSISAELMVAGANQQLIATKLTEPPPPLPPAVPMEAAAPPPAKQSEDGTLEIEHEPAKSEAPQIDIDENGSFQQLDEKATTAPDTAPSPEPPKPSDAAMAGLPEPVEPPDVTPGHTEGPHMMLEPPTLGGQLSAEASSRATDFFDPMMDSASGAPATGQPKILNREPLGEQHAEKDKDTKKKEETSKAAESAPPPLDSSPPPPPASAPPTPPPVSEPSASSATPPPADLNTETLSEIEEQLHSPHLAASNNPAPAEPTTPPAVPAPTSDSSADNTAADNAAAHVASARSAVDQAMQNNTDDKALEPIKALNAQPVNLNLHDDDATTPADKPDLAASSMPTQSVMPATPASYAPPGLSLPGVDLGPAGQVTEPPPAAANDQTPAKDAHDPATPPPLPPPMLPPLPGQ